MLYVGASWAQTYAVRDLGALSEISSPPQSRPNAINAVGQIAGANVLGGAYRALLYGGAWTNLGTLGGANSFGAGLNNSAQVVGYSSTAAGLDHAFLWTLGGSDGVPGNVQMKDLGTLGGNSSEAYAINQVGQVAGFAQTTKNDRAFRYSGGSMTDIGALLGSLLPNSYAYGINDAGHITGAAYNNNFTIPHAFFYNGAMAVDLGSFSNQGASGLAINNNDQIAGYSTTSDGFDHAFRYLAGTLTDLGTLGGNWSYATAINNSNVIVGGSFSDSGDSIYHAFVCPATTLVDLNTRLDSSGVGWVLVEARGINDIGQIIGVGTFAGADHAFLLNPLPQITAQPINVTSACQDNALFTVTASPLPLSYQWYKGPLPNGSLIANATNNTLALTNVTGSQSGPYYVVVKSSVASITSATATLSVLDSTPPAISGCSGNLTNSAEPDVCSAIVTWATPMALDSCEGVVAVTCTPPSGSRFNRGTTTVACVANDSSGNTNACTFTVTVLDKQAPTIFACPVNLTNYIPAGATSTLVNWNTPTASDNCGEPVPVICVPPSGSVFTAGMTSVTCKAGDSSGNTNNCNFTVSVVPAQIPVITDLKVVGANIVISFQSMNAGNYSVQTTSTPAGSWSDVLTGIQGNGGTITVTNMGGASFLPRFFRVKLSLP